MNSSPTDVVRRIVVDVTIDMNCPWCFFALRHLRTALAIIDDDVRIDIKFHHFILFPGLPPAGINLTPCMLTADVKSAAISSKVILNNQRLLLPTLGAHVILHAAEIAGVAIAFTEALFCSYFEQGNNINDPMVLSSAARSVGMSLSEADVSAMIAEDSPNVKALLLLENSTRTSGIKRVPHFIVKKDGKRCKFEFEGAAGPEIFGDAIDELECQR